MIKDLFKKLLDAAGYRLIKQDFLEKHYHPSSDPRFRLSGKLEPLEQLLYKHIDDNFFFIQIGANNGLRYDPINYFVTREKQFVKGIAIEPVQEYFDDLQLTYKDFPEIKLMRTAIHNTLSESTIYKINPALPGIAEQLKGMSSFQLSNLTKDGVLEKDIIADKVPCISFMDLINSEHITKLHLLQIDAEGYDLEIIRSIDFEKIKPRIINFEHRWHHDLIPESEIFGVLRRLINNGYKIVLNGNDALAYLD